MKIEEFSTAKFFLKQNHQLLFLLYIDCYCASIPFSVSSLIFAKDEKWKCGRLVVSFHQDFKK